VSLDFGKLVLTYAGKRIPQNRSRTKWSHLDTNWGVFDIVITWWWTRQFTKSLINSPKREQSYIDRVELFLYCCMDTSRRQTKGSEMFWWRATQLTCHIHAVFLPVQDNRYVAIANRWKKACCKIKTRFWERGWKTGRCTWNKTVTDAKKCWSNPNHWFATRAAEI